MDQTKVEQSTMEQILELLVMMNANQAKMEANQARLDAKWDADKAESKAERKADKEEMMAKMNANQARMEAMLDACLGETKALPETTEACPVKTRACPEKREPAPEETEPVAESEGVPEEAIGAAKERSRDRRLAVRCRGRLKTRTKRDGRLRQECAATIGRPTRRSVPAIRKGGLRKGPGRMCRRSCIRGQIKASRNGKRGRIVGRDQQPAVGYRSPLTQHTKQIVVRDTPEGRVCEKRRRTQPRCNSGIKDRGMKQRPHLGRVKKFIEADGQNFGLEVVERTVGSSTILRSPSIWLLWKCRPPPKRKR
jgi:hypothetical protein